MEESERRDNGYYHSERFYGSFYRAKLAVVLQRGGSNGLSRRARGD